MLRKILVPWLICGSWAGSALLAEGAQLSLSALPSSVAYLYQTSAQQTQIAGTDYEVWLKGPNDKSPQLQLQTTFGTAFFLRAGPKTFLVTASHVARNTARGPRIILLGESGKPHDFALADLTGAPGDWKAHPRADVSALLLTPNLPMLADYLGRHSLPLEMLEPQMMAPALDRELTLVGFPNGLGVSSAYFSPLVLRSPPASGILTGSGIAFPFFTLERPSMGGYSGAPVFDLGYRFSGAGGTGLQSSYGPTRIVGLVHGNFHDASGGALAIVLPSSLVVELIRSIP